MAYDAGAGDSALRIVTGGELVSLRVDGQEAKTPTQDLSRLYRLLAQRGYTPAGFRWLGRPVAGKRQRLQTYTRA